MLTVFCCSSLFQPGTSVAYRIIGIRLLTAVATEMNLTSNRTPTKFRKIAVSFRDTQLLPTFQFALTMLSSVLQLTGNGSPGESTLIERRDLEFLRPRAFCV